MAAQGRARKKQPRKSLRDQALATLAADSRQAEAEAAAADETLELSGAGDASILTLKSRTIRTLDEALAVAKVDLSVWEVERWLANKWDSVAKKGVGERARLMATELWQVKVWLRRKKYEVRTWETLLEEIKSHSPRVPKLRRAKTIVSRRRALEILIMDPHMGLRCFPPGAEHGWSMDDCEQAVLWSVNGLLEKAAHDGPFEEIVLPIGNDWFHCDGVFHTTTKGTSQPDADSWHEAYRRGSDLGIAMVNILKAIAPVKVFPIPGNHDRQSTYTFGRFLWAYFHQDANVTVDDGCQPYKFWRYGANLVGLEHGHSIKPQSMPALMANKQAQNWGETDGGFREWHLGDQHRKGVGRIMEEQGVSVEFFPALTPANEWHVLNAYSGQKRGATAIVWDFEHGPVSRLYLNMLSWKETKPAGTQPLAGAKRRKVA